jgi:putative hydrolase of the HAD superfamily
MIKVVVFDLGKVLVDFDYSIAARKIIARGKVTLAQIAQVLGQSPLLLHYEAGGLTNEEFYKEISTLTGFDGCFEEFADCFGDIFSPIEPMIALHASLRQSGLPTFIFSNTNDLAIRVIRRNFPFFANFDGYVLSYQHGFLKPDPKLYEVVERQCGRRGSEILYLDDRPENIATGATRGWQVILQESPEKTRTLIEKMGLLNGSPKKS